MQATTTQGVALMYGVDTAAEAVGIAEILSVTKPSYPVTARDVRVRRDAVAPRRDVASSADVDEPSP
jgi:hypothetical protein